MKTKKMLKKHILVLLLIITCLNLINCKKESGSNENLRLNDKIKSQNIDSIKLVKNDTIDSKNNKQKELSFVISCGSGCALTYNEESRSINNSNYEIKFKVTNYIDEKISEENIKIYIFEFDSSTGVVKNIHLKDKNENILLNEDILVRPELIRIALHSLHPFYKNMSQ
jgi:hypothetical protein